jgi:uncharacterized protein (DUF362 family)
MKRRTFIRQGAVLVGAAAVAGPVPAAAAEPAVVKVTGESPADMCRRAVAELGGMKAFVSRGDVVMVKPNIGWNRAVEQAACTNPAVVRALVEMAYGAGAKKVIVMDRSCHRPEDTYARSGIEAAVRQAGAEVRYADDGRLVNHDFKGQVLRSWPVYRDFLEVDKFINVPILKHHGSAGLTIAMKNLFGIVGGDRGKLHRDMGENIADLALSYRSHLVVVDAYRVLMRNGPVGGRVSDVEFKKTIIASSDIMRADVLAAALFGAVPAEIEFLQAAADRGMGPLDPSRIAVKAVSV